MTELRALLVEDDPDDAELLLHELRRSGYACEHLRVDTPEAFREAIDRGSWDVILSDFSMPRFSAPAALEILKATGKDVPFIIVSGSVSEAIAVQAMRAGAQDFLSKSNLHRLAAAVERETREVAVRDERRSAMARLVAAEERYRLVVENDLRQAIAARDEFLSIASHELKTPLTSMELQLDRLRRLGRTRPDLKLSDEEVASKIDTIGRQAERLTILVSTLLDVTRITSGRLDLRPEPVDLGELVDRTIARLRPAIDRAGCRLSVHAERGVLGCWDRARIETVVANLVANAIKYGAGKPVDITIGKDGTSARLSVQDSGIGISPEEQARIFERFERAVPEQHYGGLGLGLWIVRQVAAAHGGVVHVQSGRDEGSTFTVELPLAPPAEGAS